MGAFAYLLIQTLDICFEILNTVILIYCIASWFVKPGGKLFYYWYKLGQFLSPLFYPARWILSKTKITQKLGIDFTPWLTVILLEIAYSVIMRILSIFLYF